MTSERETPSDESRHEDSLTNSCSSWQAPEQLRTDGGSTADDVDDTVLDPWGSSTINDYRKLFEEFGIEQFESILDEVSNPHYLMRRGVIFGHRDYRPVAEAMQNNEPFAALSGFMPTGDPHIGHKLVFDELIWHQQQGGDVYALIADLEAHAARGMTWGEIDQHAKDYILSLLALGFDPEQGTLYRQSENRGVQDLAFELGIEANFSELESIYGFDGETDVSHMQSVVTQMADICYPQAVDQPKPTVIPVGPDQDPHVRLARDLAARTRYFGVSEAYASFAVTDEERSILATAFAHREEYAEDPDRPRCVEAATWIEEQSSNLSSVERTVVQKLENAGKEPLRPRVRILNRNATDDAFESLIEAIDGEKRVYDEHIDTFDLDQSQAASLARDVELEHGGYGFLPPASIYHRFMTGLTGGKMSSSVPASHISLLDDPERGAEKVQAAATGGRETADKQRELGGKADECPVYELYAYLLADDNDEFATEVYEECVNGKRLCGSCKEQAADLMESFLSDHQQKRDEWKDRLDEIDINLESSRQ